MRDEWDWGDSVVLERKVRKRRKHNANHDQEVEFHKPKHERKMRRRSRARMFYIPRGMPEDRSEAIRQTRPRHHRVCDLGRSSCGDCDYCDYCLQAQIKGTLGRNSQWHQQLVIDESGQSTVEYAVIFGAFACAVAALVALAASLDAGLFVTHALSSAAYCVQNSLTGVIDVFCF